MPPVTKRRRKPPCRAHRVDRKLIVALGTVFIRVAGQVVQTWIDRRVAKRKDPRLTRGFARSMAGVPLAGVQGIRWGVPHDRVRVMRAPV